jgi:O-antigen ligase
MSYPESSDGLMTDYTESEEYGYCTDDDGNNYLPDAQQGVSDDFAKYAVVLLIVSGIIASLFVLAGNLKMGIIMAALPLVLAILISPFVGICLLAFTLPLAGLLQIIPGLFTGSKALAILVVLSYLPRLLFVDLRRVFVSRSLQWYVLASLWGVFTLLYSQAILPGLIVTGINLQIVGMGFLIAAIPKNFNQLRYIALSALAGAAFLGIYIAIFGMSGLTAEHVESGRLAGGQNENQLAHALCIGLLAAGIAWQESGKKMKILILVFSLFTFVAIGLTRSRGVWLALFAALAGGIFLSRKISLKHKLYFVAGTFVFGCLAVLLLLKGGIGGMAYEITERFRSIGEAKSSGGRLEWIWPMYLKTFLSNPIFGAGVGYSRVAGAASHNDFIEILAEQGLVGTVLYLIMFLVFYREASRNQYTWLKLTSVIIIFFLIAAGGTHNTVSLKSFGLAAGLLAGQANLGLCPKQISFDSEQSEYSE